MMKKIVFPLVLLMSLVACTGAQAPVPTPTRTPVIVSAMNWYGTWEVKLNGDSFSMVVERTGNLIVAWAIEPPGLRFDFVGTVSEDDSTVTGTYVTSGGADGTFGWQLLDGSINQFHGFVDGGNGPGPYCGWRNTNPMPDPCLGP
ncbi:MAG: hypothetical protein DWQ07_04785 [Chloroflexi bacterium]|nr:MAG: hypothetical protein DWQ07_04785 [Chloroflexota bacterium]MBL1194747.1 hypothetical protein [Chloroflexota bacterium]NOH12039.1 hypothetical protein [Chloroflexota bacterium]